MDSAPSGTANWLNPRVRSSRHIFRGWHPILACYFWPRSVAMTASEGRSHCRQKPLQAEHAAINASRTERALFREACALRCQILIASLSDAQSALANLTASCDSFSSSVCGTYCINSLNWSCGSSEGWRKSSSSWEVMAAPSRLHDPACFDERLLTASCRAQAGD